MIDLKSYPTLLCWVIIVLYKLFCFQFYYIFYYSKFFPKNVACKYNSLILECLLSLAVSGINYSVTKIK